MQCHQLSATLQATRQKFTTAKVGPSTMVLPRQCRLCCRSSCRRPTPLRVGPQSGSNSRRIDVPRWWHYLGASCLPLAIITSVGTLCTCHLTSKVATAVSFSAFLLGFAIVPALDFLLPVSSGYNPTKAEQVALVKDRRFQLALRTFVPLQLLAVLLSCWYVAAHSPSLPVVLGTLISLSTSASIAFTAAHELVHSSHKGDTVWADALLAAVCYMHWRLSHMAHHDKVATPQDPASARRGEPYWGFLLRSVLGNLRDGSRAEKLRLEREGHSVWSWHNRMWVWLFIPAAIVSSLGAMWGCAAVGVFLGQAVGGVMLLEAVNYVEHYGLLRRMEADGRWEAVGPQHSWNADFSATNCISFRLQRHADHHMHARRPYQVLMSLQEESPQLPACYPIMILLAAIPPAWFHIMNPLLEAEQARISATSLWSDVDGPMPSAQLG